AGSGIFFIPGMGPFLAAGPFIAALSGASLGLVIGGMVGAFIGRGFPEYEARRYEGKLNEGNILLSVHAEEGRQVRRVRDIFERAGASDIATCSEAAVK